MAADFNQFTVICRLTRDPERRDFGSGGAVVNMGLAFTGNTRKNQQTGQYEDEPCFLDAKAFISNDGRGIGDVVMRFCRKGSRVFIAGRLILEQWEDRNTGAKMRAHRLIVERLSLLDGRSDNGGGNNSGGGNQNRGGNRAAGRGQQNAGSWDDFGGGNDAGGFGGSEEDPIPF